MLGSACAARSALIPMPTATPAVVHRTRKRAPSGGPLARQSPKSEFPNMQPPSKTRGPIVRGDGANKNGEFQVRTQKNREVLSCARASMHRS